MNAAPSEPKGDEAMAKKHHRSYELKADQPTAITPIEYGGLQEAFEHFNKELFGSALPDVFITYQRKAHSFGYFSPDRFSGRIGKWGKHELALNPDGFINQTDEQICQTLTHEMVHLWQHAHGRPGARGYHNKEWAAKMKAIGLQPSSTGMVGGKETGQKMIDYIIPNAPFATAYAKLAATGWKLNLQSAHRPGAKGGTNSSKTKFTCPACGQNAWGKPDLEIVCKPCGADMLAPAPPVEFAPEPVPSYEPTSLSYDAISPMEAEPTKRKPGRPKGSKNKPKRGRPKGSKNRPKIQPGTVSAKPHGEERV
jgi:SprT-like family protein